MKKIKSLIGLGLIFAVMLSACESLPFNIPWLTDDIATATPPPGDIDAMTQTPDMPTDMDIERTPEPVSSLTVWVPPEMDPNLETNASRIFSNQLQSFSELNGGVEINVRVKAATGVGGLLDALTATSAAAPAALPDVIALTRPDMEIAALKGLIFPLDGLTEIPDDTDWYAFTRDLALLQGSTFGFPFAADALVLVYRPSNIPEFPRNWEGLFEEDIVLAFPAESDQALFQLALYQGEGGAIQDNQRRPVLEVDPLTEVFRIFQEGVTVGTFPEWISQYQTSGQVWTAFKEGQVDLVVTWLSNYLQDGPADAAMAPFFPSTDGVVSVGTGKSWAVASPDEARQAVAVELAEFLVQPDFLEAWSTAAGYLPPRPSALEGWRNQSLRTVVTQVALMTRLRPSNDVISSLGPVLREATRKILQELIDPAQAAQVAVESLGEQ